MHDEKRRWQLQQQGHHGGHRPWLSLGLSLALLGCAQGSSALDLSQGPESHPDAGPGPVDPPKLEPTQVKLLDSVAVYFTGTDNKRSVENMVAFPAIKPGATYGRVVLHIELACPQGQCDPWDRVGSLSLVEGQPGSETVLEVARFITPYGVGGSWDLDVTDLQLLLAGTRRVRGFIDTWVGPGSAYGNGWLLSASVRFEVDGTAPRPVAIQPLGWTSTVYGDPARPVSGQLLPKQISVPAGATGSAAVHVVTTGHGQGNLDNCAEFCQRNHSIVVDGQASKQLVWRSDCSKNPVNNQKGNWQYPRAGWCPGDIVKPWRVDLGTRLAPGTTHTVGYDVDPYVNSCRPDAATCGGCALGTGCAYDGGAHTEPYYLVSGYVIYYAP